MTGTRNIPASIMARLKNLSREEDRPFQDVLVLYGIERFLHRLGSSPYAKDFVLKGGLMLVAWEGPRSRPTRDIDLLGRTVNEPETLAQIVRDVCGMAVEPDDGLCFDAASARTERIKEDADYEGVRVLFHGFIGRARIPMQIDVGFNDIITPRDELLDYPVLLDFAAPRVRGYNRETLIAEKFEAMVYLGLLNSRMKDFFDIWLLSRDFAFDGARLQTACRKTFAQRKTDMAVAPVALTEAFGQANDKQQQWAAFLRNTRIQNAQRDFAVLHTELAAFLMPLAESMINGNPFTRQWLPAGPWR